MDINALKNKMPMPDLARWLGFEPNRGGFIRCPFHDERTASLKLYDGQGGWHCYGCGKYGDQIDFLRLLHRLDFKEAMAELARIAGVELQLAKPAPALFSERKQADKIRREYRLAAIDKKLGGYIRELAHIASVLEQRPESWGEIDDEFIHALHRENVVIDAIERLEHERSNI